MKAETYDALAALNRGFEMALESLKILQDEGIISPEFASDQDTMTQELRAAINYMIVQRLTAREIEDCDHFRKMRETIEARMKAS